jgi:hypothetical protein
MGTLMEVSREFVALIVDLILTNVLQGYNFIMSNGSEIVPQARETNNSALEMII